MPHAVSRSLDLLRQYSQSSSSINNNNNNNTADPTDEHTHTHTPLSSPTVLLRKVKSATSARITRLRTPPQPSLDLPTASLPTTGHLRLAPLRFPAQLPRLSYEVDDALPEQAVVTPDESASIAVYGRTGMVPAGAAPSAFGPSPNLQGQTQARSQSQPPSHVHSQSMSYLPSSSAASASAPGTAPLLPGQLAHKHNQARLAAHQQRPSLPHFHPPASSAPITVSPSSTVGRGVPRSPGTSPRDANRPMRITGRPGQQQQQQPPPVPPMPTTTPMPITTSSGRVSPGPNAAYGHTMPPQSSRPGTSPGIYAPYSSTASPPPPTPAPTHPTAPRHQPSFSQSAINAPSSRPLISSVARGQPKTQDSRSNLRQHAASPESAHHTAPLPMLDSSPRGTRPTELDFGSGPSMQPRLHGTQTPPNFPRRVLADNFYNAPPPSRMQHSQLHHNASTPELRATAAIAHEATHGPASPPATVGRMGYISSSRQAGVPQPRTEFKPIPIAPAQPVGAPQSRQQPSAERNVAAAATMQFEPGSMNSGLESVPHTSTGGAGTQARGEQGGFSPALGLHGVALAHDGPLPQSSANGQASTRANPTPASNQHVGAASNASSGAASKIRPNAVSSPLPPQPVEKQRERQEMDGDEDEEDDGEGFRRMVPRASVAPSLLHPSQSLAAARALMPAESTGGDSSPRPISSEPPPPVPPKQQQQQQQAQRQQASAGGIGTLPRMESPKGGPIPPPRGKSKPGLSRKPAPAYKTSVPSSPAIESAPRTANGSTPSLGAGSGPNDAATEPSSSEVPLLASDWFVPIGGSASTSSLAVSASSSQAVLAADEVQQQPPPNQQAESAFCALPSALISSRRDETARLAHKELSATRNSVNVVPPAVPAKDDAAAASAAAPPPHALPSTMALLPLRTEPTELLNPATLLDFMYASGGPAAPPRSPGCASVDSYPYPLSLFSMKDDDARSGVGVEGRTSMGLSSPYSPEPAQGHGAFANGRPGGAGHAHAQSSPVVTASPSELARQQPRSGGGGGGIHRHSSAGLESTLDLGTLQMLRDLSVDSFLVGDNEGTGGGGGRPRGRHSGAAELSRLSVGTADGGIGHANAGGEETGHASGEGMMPEMSRCSSGINSPATRLKALHMSADTSSTALAGAAGDGVEAGPGTGVPADASVGQRLQAREEPARDAPTAAEAAQHSGIGDGNRARSSTTPARPSDSGSGGMDTPPTTAARLMPMSVEEARAKAVLAASRLRQQGLASSSSPTRHVKKARSSGDLLDFVSQQQTPATATEEGNSSAAMGSHNASAVPSASPSAANPAIRQHGPIASEGKIVEQRRQMQEKQLREQQYAATALAARQEVMLAAQRTELHHLRFLVSALASRLAAAEAHLSLDLRHALGDPRVDELVRRSAAQLHQLAAGTAGTAATQGQAPLVGGVTSDGFFDELAKVTSPDGELATAAATPSAPAAPMPAFEQEVVHKDEVLAPNSVPSPSEEVLPTSPSRSLRTSTSSSILNQLQQQQDQQQKNAIGDTWIAIRRAKKARELAADAARSRDTILSSTYSAQASYPASSVQRSASNASSVASVQPQLLRRPATASSVNDPFYYSNSGGTTASSRIGSTIGGTSVSGVHARVGALLGRSDSTASSNASGGAGPSPGAYWHSRNSSIVDNRLLSPTLGNGGALPGSLPPATIPIPAASSPAPVYGAVNLGSTGLGSSGGSVTGASSSSTGTRSVWTSFSTQATSLVDEGTISQHHHHHHGGSKAGSMSGSSLGRSGSLTRSASLGRSASGRNRAPIPHDRLTSASGAMGTPPPPPALTIRTHHTDRLGAQTPNANGNGNGGPNAGLGLNREAFSEAAASSPMERTPSPSYAGKDGKFRFPPSGDPSLAVGHSEAAGPYPLSREPVQGHARLPSENSWSAHTTQFSPSAAGVAPAAQPVRFPASAHDPSAADAQSVSGYPLLPSGYVRQHKPSLELDTLMPSITEQSEGGPSARTSMVNGAGR